MRKIAKVRDGKNAAAGEGPLWLRLPGLVREALYETVIGAGLACVDEALEAERVELCGPRYQHLPQPQVQRAGHVASSLVLGGRRVAVADRECAAAQVMRSSCRAGASGARAIH